MVNVIEELLLLKNSHVEEIAVSLNRVALYFTPIFVYLGVISEKMSNWDFSGVGRRMFQSILCLLVIFPLIIPSIRESHQLANDILKRQTQNNNFVKSYLSNVEAVEAETGSKWDWKVFENLSQKLPQIITSKFLMGICYIIFSLLKQIYSAIYYLNLCFFGFICGISILPITRDALGGLIKTWLWLMLMPFVVAILLMLIGDGSSFFVGAKGGGLIDGAETLFQFIVIGILLLFSPVITEKILTSSGMTSVGSQLGKAFSIPFVHKSMGLIPHRQIMFQASQKIGSALRSQKEHRALASNFKEVLRQNKNPSVNEKGNVSKGFSLAPGKNSLFGNQKPAKNQTHSIVRNNNNLEADNGNNKSDNKGQFLNSSAGGNLNIKPHSDQKNQIKNQHIQHNLHKPSPEKQISSPLRENGPKIIPRNLPSVRDYKKGQQLVQKVSGGGMGAWKKMSEKDLVKMASTHNSAQKYRHSLDKNWGRGVLKDKHRHILKNRLKERGFQVNSKKGEKDIL